MKVEFSKELNLKRAVAKNNSSWIWWTKFRWYFRALPLARKYNLKLYFEKKLNGFLLLQAVLTIAPKPRPKTVIFAKSVFVWWTKLDGKITALKLEIWLWNSCLKGRVRKFYRYWKTKVSLPSTLVARHNFLIIVIFFLNHFLEAKIRGKLVQLFFIFNGNSTDFIFCLEIPFFHN